MLFKLHFFNINTSQWEKFFVIFNRYIRWSEMYRYLPNFASLLVKNTHYKTTKWRIKCKISFFIRLTSSRFFFFGTNDIPYSGLVHTPQTAPISQKNCRFPILMVLNHRFSCFRVSFTVFLEKALSRSFFFDHK